MKGESKDSTQGKSKDQKPSENSKGKTLPIKSVKVVLEIFTHRKHAQHASPSVRTAPKLLLDIGRRLVKVRNQENYLKLLKKKNPSSWAKSYILAKSKATLQSHHGWQPFLWTRIQ